MSDGLDGLNEQKAAWIKWGKVGDWIRGTLCDVREMENMNKPGEKVKIYEFIAKGGSFHHFEKVNGAVKVDESAGARISSNRIVKTITARQDIGDPLSLKDMERALSILNDTPGISVTTAMAPGACLRCTSTSAASSSAAYPGNGANANMLWLYVPGRPDAWLSRCRTVISP